MAHATKQLLANALKKKLNQKTLDKITVTELAEDCGVNRQTFYYNFQDIYDLLDWTLEQERQQLWLTADLNTYSLENLTILLEYLKTNKTFVLNTYHSLAHPLLEKTLKNDVRPLVELAIDHHAEGTAISQDDRAFIIRIYTLAAGGILREWLDHDMDDTYDLDIARLLPLLHCNLQFNIKQLSGGDNKCR